jgi:hypothetical protein
MGRTEFSTRNDYDASLGLERHFFSESEMALFFECTPKCAPKLLDTADIVRDACLRQSCWYDRKPLVALVIFGGLLRNEND